MKAETYESVWDAPADAGQEAANFKARPELLYAIRKVVTGWELPREEAAKRLGLTRPRLSDLSCGKPAGFSLDAPVNIAASARLTGEIRVTDPA